MDIDNITGTIFFDNKLVITPFITKKEIMRANDLIWEAWPSKGDRTISYRTIFDIKKNRDGNIYLIINFFRPNDMNSTVASWRFAPEKLLMGEQKKMNGKVTQQLREWFINQTKNDLPIYGLWGSIDTVYDPHNRTGTIFCNYNSNLRN